MSKRTATKPAHELPHFLGHVVIQEDRENGDKRTHIYTALWRQSQVRGIYVHVFDNGQYIGKVQRAGQSNADCAREAIHMDLFGYNGAILEDILRKEYDQPFAPVIVGTTRFTCLACWWL